MSPVYLGRLGKKDFGLLLAPEGIRLLRIEKRDGIHQAIAEAPTNDSLLALWRFDPNVTGELPEVLICADNSRMDWVAWITTYARAIRPSSSFVRCMEHREAEIFLGISRSDISANFAWAASGIVLGEVLASSQISDAQLESLPTAVFLSTLSYAVFKSWHVYGVNHAEGVSATWELARSFVGIRERNVKKSDVTRVCRIVLAAFGSEDTENDSREDHQLSSILRSIIFDSTIIPDDLHSYSGFREAFGEMQGTREGRVVALSKFSEKRLAGAVAGDQTFPFAFGYLASLVAPGTMQHIGLLETVAVKYPEVMMWYGFFAGLAQRPQGELFDRPARTGADMPLAARRVLRELQRPENLFGRPTADISIWEFLALGRTGKAAIEVLPRRNNSYLVVELSPGVESAVGMGSKVSQDSTKSPKVVELIRSLGTTIEQSRRIIMEMSAALGEDEKSNSVVATPHVDGAKKSRKRKQ